MASRKEQKEQLRAERERREQDAAGVERRKRMIGVGAASVLVIAVIAAIALLVSNSGGGGGKNDRAATPKGNAFVNAPIPGAKASNLEAAAKAAGCKVQTFPSEGRNHVSGHVNYKTNPPNSGNHNEFPAQDGPYAPGSAPSIEMLVHSLEHGRIIFWYQPKASAQLKGQLKSLYDEDPYHVILAPNTRDMPYPVAASAWTRTIVCPKVTPQTWDALRLFRDRYRDQAPERVQ